MFYGMPTQKIPLSSNMDNHLNVDVDADGDGEGEGNSDDPGVDNHQIQEMIATVDEEKKSKESVAEEAVLQRCDDSRDYDEEGDGSSSSSSSKDEYVEVKLADIRKEVQCPICLGIIRKTRTVMECLHRFCRECIDKSMRLGNNECPACRTHCASRRSLRDDPKYDALIAALYPDIDKYEEEELTFHEEETNRNKKIQASIAETLRRQTEALGKKRVTSKATAAAFMRKSRRSRNKSFTRDSGGHGSDEDEDADDNNGGKDFSSADERCQDARSKRPRRLPGARLSPALGASNSDGGCAENEDTTTGSREFRGASPGKACNREVLVWGKGGVRSQTRHGSGSSANGKNVKGNRFTKLVDYLRNLDEKEDEFDLHLTLVPLDKDKVPSLERPYLCCRPTLSVKHICHFIALQTSIHAEEIEILVRKPWNVTLEHDSSLSSLGDTIPKGQADTLEDELQIVEAQESLSRLHAFSSSSPGNLVLIYRAKN